MTTDRIIRFAIVGMNGYSRDHINSVLDLQRTDAGVKLAAVSTRRRQTAEEYAAKLESQGVRIVGTLNDLLSDAPPPDVACIPTSIDLHVAMTQAALDKGCAVVVEKPVAATVQEVDALIEARNRAARPVIVGFQHLSQDRYWNIKRRLRDGIVGPVREVRGLFASPRAISYYARANWAGKMSVNGTWVLDSPFNNACAHYLLQCLFFADPASAGTAQPLQVAAELYRAQPIEGPDTASLEVFNHNGVRVLFLVSHAIEENFGPEISVIGERGRLIVTREELFLEQHGQRVRIEETPPVGDPFSAIVRMLRGETDVPHCSLEMARPQTVVVNGAHQSSAVRVLKPEAIDVKMVEPTATTAADRRYRIKGLFGAMQKAYAEGIPLHQTGQLAWTRPAESVDVSHLTKFTGPRSE